MVGHNPEAKYHKPEKRLNPLTRLLAESAATIHIPPNLLFSLEVLARKILSTNNFELVTGMGNPDLVNKIGHLLKKSVDNAMWDPDTNQVRRFPDGEARPIISAKKRRRHIVIVQSSGPPVDKNLIELLLMIDAARNSSAGEISVVLPYPPYQRQDRKQASGVPLAAHLVLKLIEEAGANRVIMVDPHFDQIQGVTRGPIDIVYSSYDLIPEIKKVLRRDGIDLASLIGVAPDTGAAKRTNAYITRAGSVKPIAVVSKIRDATTGKSESYGISQPVKDHNVLIVDDMLAGGETIRDATEICEQNGARNIYVVCAHGLFLPGALKLITKSPIKRLFVTDSLPLPPEVTEHPKIIVVSIAPLLARTIMKVHYGTPMESLFIE